MAWPRLYRVEQRFRQPHVADPEATAYDTVTRAIAGRSLAGQSVAVPVGSRGIANIAAIARGIVAALRKSGAEPFVIPAMGSHGGGTANGQVEVLASLGVTERSVGAPIRASMDTVRVGETEDGFSVVIDRYAAEADHILVVNRVKLHTEFSGPYQSGLLKMLLIGLGKHTGAIAYHQAAMTMPFEQLIRTAAQVVIDRTALLAGIAIIENAQEQTADLIGVAPNEFLAAEPALLERAASYMPRIPYDDVDLLIVDEIGKNISGAGMDTNIIRRKHWAEYAVGEQSDPKASKRVFVRDLTDETHGNAAGIGLADFTLTRVVEKIDRRKTYTNTITATRPRGAMLPLTFETDEEAIRMALRSAGVSDPCEGRIVRIRNTMRLKAFEVSDALAREAPADADVRVAEDGSEMAFDERGMLIPDKLPV